MRPLVISGQRVILTMNDKLIAAGHVLDYVIETQYQEIEGVDSVIPFELAPARIKVRLNVRVYRTADNDPAYNDYIAPGGIQNPFSEELSDFVAQRYIKIEIRDKQTDNTILFCPRAMIVARSGSVSAEDILTENWSIVGMGFSGPSTGGLMGSLKNLF